MPLSLIGVFLLTDFVSEFSFNQDPKDIVAKNTDQSNASLFCAFIISSIKKLFSELG